MTMKMRGAVLRKVREPLAIEEVTLAPLGPRDVLIRNRTSGLCHTDLEVIEGSFPLPLPIILGHEGAGVVEAVGPEVTAVRRGDHVVASWNPHCGHCFYCDRAEPILCEVFKNTGPRGHLLDGRSRLSVDGEKLHHFGLVSSHAEYSIVPESGAIRVPSEIPFEVACLIGCGVMTGVGAVVRRARVQPGSTMVVVGCGAVGLNAVQGGRIASAARIIAVDRDPRRLATARAFGATDTVAVDEETIAAVQDLTEGRGADAVFECAGAEQAMRLSCELTRPGGQLIILGKVSASQNVSLRFGSLMGEKRLIRSSYGGAIPSRDFPWLARLYLEGKLLLDELVTTRLPLDRINEGFDAMRRGEIVRAVVTMA